MHGVRVELARRQAASIGLPLDLILLSHQSSNEEYDSKMSEYLLRRKAEGVGAMIFGDIFLEDLRAWREANLARVGMAGVFPLWKCNTSELIEEFIDLDFGSIVCCVNAAYLDESILGRTIDRAFVDRLPANVDPCGENGEFHTFAFKGPIFEEQLRVRVGENVYREGFWFCELTEET